VTLPGPGEAHVWLAAPDFIDFDLSADYPALLDDEEAQTFAKFVFDRDRRLYLTAHALLRTTLSRYASVPPAAWRFVRNRYGRPTVDSSAGLPPIAFSLSHTRGLAACLVANTVDAGVDVEQARAVDDLGGVARLSFSPAEYTALSAIAEEAARARRFFTLWTLKESYIKARGMGLSLPLADFSFHLSASRITVDFAPTLNDSPSEWQFAVFAPSPEHQLAVALRCGGRALAVSIFAATPLRSDAHPMPLVPLAASSAI
jgi:4'-phosphopantetheinyl transferase